MEQTVQGGRKSSTCVACGGQPSFFGTTRHQYIYVCCGRCGTVQLSPFPDAEDIERAYQQSEYASDDSHGQGDADNVRLSSKPYYSSIQRVLQDYRVSDGVLDYGAGWGGLVEMLRDSQIDCAGLEMSQKMVMECQRRGLPVRQGNLSTIQFPARSLKAITMCGVFEHLLCPGSWLSQAHDVLDDQGLFVSLQPTAAFARILAVVLRGGSRRRPLPSQFYVFDAPWHVALFSVKGMTEIASAHGFESLEVRPAPQGKLNGWIGLLQACAGLANRAGWAISGSDWPLLVAHIFVFRKRSVRH